MQKLLKLDKQWIFGALAIMLAALLWSTEEIPQSLLKMIREVKITDVDEIGGKSEELERLASQYPAGSFERKAVEEEIGRVTREL